MTAATEGQRIDDRTGCGCEELVVHAPAERGWYTGDCWWHGASGSRRRSAASEFVDADGMGTRETATSSVSRAAEGNCMAGIYDGSMG